MDSLIYYLLMGGGRVNLGKTNKWLTEFLVLENSNNLYNLRLLYKVADLDFNFLLGILVLPGRMKHPGLVVKTGSND